GCWDRPRVWRGRSWCLVQSHAHLPLVEPADDGEVESDVCGVEDAEEVVERRQGPARCGNEQVAPLEAGALGGAAFLDRLNEKSVALRQADRAPEPLCCVRRRERDPQLPPLRALAAAESLDPRAQVGICGEGEDQPPFESQRVQADQPPLPVEEGATGRAAGERGIVLDRRAQPAPARATERPPGT